MIDRSKPLTEATPADLRVYLDALHSNRERYDRTNRIVEARSCELTIAEVTRALAIHNRRATEAEDQREAAASGIDPELCQQLAALITHVAPNGRHPLLQVDLQAVIDQLTAAAELESHCDRLKKMARLAADQRDALRARLADVSAECERLRAECNDAADRDEEIYRLRAQLRGIRNALLGWRDDIEAATLDHGWQIVERIDAILKLAPPLEAERALTADEVRAVVREAAVALLDERKLHIVKPIQPTMNDIVLEAYGHGRACDAAALQGDDLQAVLSEIAARVAEKLAGRAVDPAQREADLREAFMAGVEHGEGWLTDEAREGASGPDEAAAAEYARSKVGG